MQLVTSEMREFMRAEIARVEKEDVGFASKEALHRYLAQRIARRFHVRFSPDTLKHQIRLYHLERKPEEIAKLEREWPAKMRAILGPEYPDPVPREPRYLSRLDNRMPARKRADEMEAD